jgi:adenosylcobyric acid synthase
LGETIRDPFGVESDKEEVRGLGLLPVETILEREKVVRRVTGTCLTNRKRVSGYEIHMGRSHAAGVIKREGAPFLSIHEPGKRHIWEDGWSLKEGKISGTYVHGILDSPGFRGDILNRIRRAKGLKERPPKQGRLGRFHQYDRLADHFEKHCKVEEILALI